MPTGSVIDGKPDGANPALFRIENRSPLMSCAEKSVNALFVMVESGTVWKKSLMEYGPNSVNGESSEAMAWIVRDEASPVYTEPALIDTRSVAFWTGVKRTSNDAVVP